MSSPISKEETISVGSDVSVKEESASEYESDARPKRKRDKGKDIKERKREFAVPNETDL